MNSCYWWGWPEGRGRGKRGRFKPGEPCSPGNSHPHVNKAWVCMCVSILGQSEKRGKDKWKWMVEVGSWGKDEDTEREGRGSEMVSLRNGNRLMIAKLCREAVLELARHLFWSNRIFKKSVTATVLKRTGQTNTIVFIYIWINNRQSIIEVFDEPLPFQATTHLSLQLQ